MEIKKWPIAKGKRAFLNYQYIQLLMIFYPIIQYQFNFSQPKLIKNIDRKSKSTPHLLSRIFICMCQQLDNNSKVSWRGKAPSNGFQNNMHIFLQFLPDSRRDSYVLSIRVNQLQKTNNLLHQGPSCTLKMHPYR